MSEPVPSVRVPAELPEGVSQETIGVRGGLLRSGFEETAEAMYLTSGYVYQTAADAEKAFTGEIDRYVYSRYGNPTVSMFEERLRLIEGAGHLSHLERPDQVNDAVREFCRTHPPGPKR